MQPQLFDDFEGRFARALRGGHLAELLDVTARHVLDASDDSEREAALALLREVAPSDPPESYDPLPYIETQTWTFAKTMPERPHEYLMLRRSTNWREHLRFVRWLRVHGEPERFAGQTWPYKTVGEWRYWAGADPSWTIINRRKAP